MFLVLAAIHSAGCRRPGRAADLSWRALFPVAQISYSLYLVHEMFMLWLFPKTARCSARRSGAHPTMAAAGVIAVADVVCRRATILYLLVEQPSMRARSLPIVHRLTERRVAGVKLESA